MTRLEKNMETIKAYQSKTQRIMNMYLEGKYSEVQFYNDINRISCTIKHICEDIKAKGYSNMQ